jgi:hypothetical protein
MALPYQALTKQAVRIVLEASLNLLEQRCE